MPSLSAMPGDAVPGDTGNDPFLAALRGAAQAPGGSKSGGKVYMGTGPTKAPSPHPPGSMADALWRQAENQSPSGPKGPRYMSQAEAENEFYKWDNQRLDKFRNQLEISGYNVSKMDRADLARAWGSLSEQASNYAANGQNISPWDILDTTNMAGGGRGLGTKVRTSTNINYTDPNTARAIMNKTMVELMGRNPTNDEIKKFTDALHQYEAQNPLVSQSVVDMETGMTTEEKTVSKQMTQAGAVQMAEDQIKMQKEYASVQAATTYFQALMRMAGGT